MLSFFNIKYLLDGKFNMYSLKSSLFIPNLILISTLLISIDAHSNKMCSVFFQNYLHSIHFRPGIFNFFSIYFGFRKLFVFILIIFQYNNSFRAIFISWKLVFKFVNYDSHELKTIYLIFYFVYSVSIFSPYSSLN